MWKLFPATLTGDNRKVPVKDFDWRNNCTSETSVINSWSSIYPQLKFYGVPTGSVNNILVLDVDTKKDNGFETLRNYQLPVTMTQVTLSGGRHYIYQYPNDGNTYGNKVGFDKGLDVRGEDGYIAYYGFDNTPIAPAPQWLLDVAIKRNKTEVNIEDAVKVSPEIANSILNEACENIREAAEGESNNILNIEAYKVGQLLTSNSIDREYAYSELFKAAKDRGKPDYEAKATIESGFKGGSENPLTSPFQNSLPELTVPIINDEPERWTPRFFTRYDLTNTKNLRKPQLFKDWSTEDIHITTADGGTGKTTLKLAEAIHLALGEDFLGFECKTEGRTLFITGEDTEKKLGAMLGVMLKQMGLMDDDKKVRKILNSIVVKKDADLCLIAKNKQGFVIPNNDALNNVREAIQDIKPKMIVFDPIASFWGSESLGNDMAKGVAKFFGVIQEESQACVEAINHMGKMSSSSKDMTQFAGRGGTGLPSHSRVSRVLRPVFNEEYAELTGFDLEEGQTAMMCNVNKFSDGSPLYNKPFLIVREGYLFSKVTLTEQKIVEEQVKMSDNERIFSFIKTERNEKRYPTKDVIIAEFGASLDKISKDRVNRALSVLAYTGHLGEKIKLVDNPDVEVRTKVFIITDMEGKEIK